MALPGAGTALGAAPMVCGPGGNENAWAGGNPAWEA
eukprot:CAMPEP_0114261172 /NCGR_PEP_ID=MMETSP0058-20121206/20962_1 /TAXON_ID=36894 /ORGANISM="Pyramimonas parkeae, CCMP726" /LENGTH=35 /DNA_ID= /DNA_START= /DNA_END= /DNA_ORIENTATION=